MGEVKNHRLIDANDLLALVKKNAPFIYSILAPITLLCPTVDAVPVVRCKDCKHYAIDFPTGLSCCARNGKVVGDEVWGGFTVDKNGYCNYGEKRDLEE